MVLPGALPSILVGLRYGASLAWALVVVAEGLSGMVGVGFLIFRAQTLLMTDQLLVCMAGSARGSILFGGRVANGE